MAFRNTKWNALTGILSAIALTACVDQVGFTAVDIGQSNDEAPVDPGPNPDNPPPPDEPQPPAPEPDPTPEPEPPAPPAPSPSPTVTETPPPPPPAPSPSPSPSVVVCDPFSNGGQADPKNGIKATLHYFEVGDPRISNVQSTQNFAAGMAGVVTPNTEIYMNYLNVPTRSFSDGFVTDEGNLMKTMSGEPLIEWFSLRMESNLVAPSVEEEGWYQFAMNADDGAILKVDPNKDNVFDTLVDNDGIHAPQLKCASKAIYLEAGKPIPFKLNYFQGPRYHITMQLLWRKVSGPSNNLGCNANSLSPVPVKAFELEPGRPNPCADK